MDGVIFDTEVLFDEAWRQAARQMLIADIEPAIRDCENGTSFQFVRVGYFCKDPDSTAELPVFNRTVELNGIRL